MEKLFVRDVISGAMKILEDAALFYVKFAISLSTGIPGGNGYAWSVMACLQRNVDADEDSSQRTSTLAADFGKIGTIMDFVIFTLESFFAHLEKYCDR